jgi:murein DD-endopeptidase MepM/ murein hydrolase activator NlpD
MAAQPAAPVVGGVSAAAPTSVVTTKDQPGKKKAGKNKKAAAKNSAAKKAAAKKAGTKKSAAKKSASKKAGTKKSVAKKAAAKKAAAKKAAAKRAAAQRAAAKRAAIAYKRAKTIKAPRMVQGRICPTRNFTYGDGWGADRGRRKHAGLDLSARRGTPLFAIESGYINRTKRQSNGALQIVMKGRSGSKYYYGHMQHVFVRGGQSVRAGQVIGTMGDSGSPGAVHLHFEYWKSGRESAAVNPASLLRTICRAAQ